MTTLIKIDGDYAEWIRNLSLRFKQSQIKAAIKVNSEMLRFYFSLGADIVNKKAESRWGWRFLQKSEQRFTKRIARCERVFCEEFILYERDVSSL